MITTHAVVGMCMLLVGLLILALTKRCRSHMVLGRMYSILLVLTVSLGFIPAYTKGIDILIPIGVLTIIQLLMGIRAVYNKEYIATYLDMILVTVYIAAVVSLLFIATQASIVMGFVYFSLLVVHVYNLHFRENKEKTLWLSQHISHMVGTIVSAITALLIGSVGILNYLWIFWVIPTVLAIWVVRHFRIKYAPIRAVKVGNLKW